MKQLAYLGNITKINPVLNYGFITTKDLKNIFFNKDETKFINCKFETLKKDDPIWVENLENTSGGLFANQVHLKTTKCVINKLNGTCKIH